MKVKFIKNFKKKDIEQITLLTIEQAEEIPMKILACGGRWWLRTAGYYRDYVTYVGSDGVIYEFGYDAYDDYSAVRPIFKINNLNAEFGNKVFVEKRLCTVIDKDLVLVDKCVCNHRFDLFSNNWENSELKTFLESERFWIEYKKRKRK